MSDLHTFKIKTGIGAFDTEVEMDGKPMNGLTRLSFEIRAGSPTALKLEIFGEVLVDGVFCETEILTASRGEK